MKQHRFDCGPDADAGAGASAVTAAAAAAAARRRWLLGGLAVLALPRLAGCGGGTELLFIPYISFTFDGTGPGNQAISFFLDTGNASGCTVSGSFAVSSGVTYNGARATLSGSFNGRRIDITLATPIAGLATSYIGQFIDDGTLTMSPVGGGTAFNVVRTGARPASCPASG